MSDAEYRRGITPHRTAAARRAAGAVLVALLLAGAVVFYRAAPEIPTTPAAAAALTPSLPADSTPTDSTTADSTTAGSTPADSTTAGSTTGTTTGTTTTSSPIRPSTVRPSTAAVAPPDPVRTVPTSRGPTKTTASDPGPPPGSGDRPTTGPGITEPGILLTASPASDGSFDVSELVLLPESQAELSLRPPPISQAGNEFRSSSPVATAVQVTAGDQPVVLPSDTLRAAVTLPLGSSEKRFELRYRLAGVTIRSIPSKAGRALAAIGPLTGRVAPDLPVAVSVVGIGVRNLDCRQLSLGQRACATGELPDLRVNRMLPWTRSVVVVQLDLSSLR